MEPLPYYKWLWRDFRSSRRVQKMDYVAEGLYRTLLDEQWDRGFIPNDVVALAEICRCPAKVMEKAWPFISPCFPANEDGMLMNRKMETMRTEKDAERVKRANAGHLGALAKASVASASKCQTDDSTCHIAVAVAVAVAVAEHKQEQSKSSRDKREPDPRHITFKAEVERYMTAKGVLFAWDGGAGKQLDLILKSVPQLDLTTFQRWLMHRARSPGVTHGEHPKAWLPQLLKYQEGTLDQFGKTGDGNGNKGFKTKSDGIVDAVRTALETTGNRGFAGEAGDSEAGSGRGDGPTRLLEGSLEPGT